MNLWISITSKLLVTGLTAVACVGTYKAHTSTTVPIGHDTIVFEQSRPTMIELPAVPDYVASYKPEVTKYNPYLEWTDEEKEILVRIAQSEAGNQGTVGMALVMRVVLNRVERNDTDVRTEVYRPKQFAIAGMAPGTWETYEALDMVQMGWDESQGALFFCADGYNGTIPLFKYKGHYFSTKE